jgi:hypothetical protein
VKVDSQREKDEKITSFFFVISNPFSNFAENYHIQFRYENVRKINRREVIEN